MAKKKTTDYFQLLEQQTSYCVTASELLQEILSKFHPESINAYRSQMHDVEHTADKLHHDILERLSTEFITPIDQEDILRLAQIIDSITDALDEVVLSFYMYHIDQVPPQCVELSKIVNRCVSTLHEAARELKNFKKPDALRSLTIRVNDIEGEADEVYVQAVHELFASPVDGKTLLGTKAILEALENCCDLCEHATDIMEQVILKNT